MSIMERLYGGGIHPCEEILPHDEAYTEACRQVETLMKKLSEQMKAEEYKEIENLCQQWSTMSDILAKESFKYGISIGLGLMKEAEELLYFSTQSK